MAYQLLIPNEEWQMAKKILVVEDVEDSRSILVVMLERYCGLRDYGGSHGIGGRRKGDS
jgi:hypothetical protein